MIMLCVSDFGIGSDEIFGMFQGLAKANIWHCVRDYFSGSYNILYSDNGYSAALFCDTSLIDID